jgi:cellulose synthase/poly-beta-1,6-N-acetylglucosamine synthase-like glycosyltransferase
MITVLRFLSSVVLLPLLVLLTMLLLDSLFRAIFLGVALRVVRERFLNPALPGDKSEIAYLFPAHNEETVIDKSVAGLSVPVYVIADNCQDKTAEVARMAGARVWERGEEEGGGKAGALRWFFRVARAELMSYSRFAIFDADSQVAPDFADQLMVSPYDRAPVLQGFVQPVVTSGSPVARLAAYSEILSQRIDDLARERLGWPVPLRGTGMVFDASLLPTLLSGLRTKVEDVEMTIQLVRRGIHPRFLSDAVVGDPKPTGIHGIAAQRARWEQGRRQIVKYYWKDLLGLFFGGHPGAMALALSLVLRPRALVLMIKVLLAVVLGLTLGSYGLIWSVLAAMAGLAVIIDGLYYLVGLGFVKERRVYALALCLAPAYLFMWIWSQIWSFVSRSAWLSVRDPRN